MCLCSSLFVFCIYYTSYIHLSIAQKWNISPYFSEKKVCGGVVEVELTIYRVYLIKLTNILQTPVLMVPYVVPSNITYQNFKPIYKIYQLIFERVYSQNCIFQNCCSDCSKTNDLSTIKFFCMFYI